MNAGRISSGQIAQYGFLAVPVAFAGYPLYVLAPDFYAANHGVSLALLGLLLLALRIFDAVQDPFIGWLSDHFSAGMFPVLAVSALVLVAAIYGLFHPIGSRPAAWFCLCMLLAVTAYSVLSINLNALGALWSKEPGEQTRITGLREAFGLLGLLIAVTLPTLLLKYFSAPVAYGWFAAILAALMLLALLAFRRWLSHAALIKRPETPRQKLGATLKALSAPTRKLFLVYAVSMLASAIPAVLVLFFIRDLLGAEDYTGLFLLLYFLSGALAMPIWKRISERHGKYRAWLGSMLLAVAAFIWAFFLGAGDVWHYAAICIASGGALGADLALPPSILADHMHGEASQDSAATQFSLLALLAKAALAIASALALPMLDAGGFVPAGANDTAALGALSFTYALLPCLIKLAAAFLLYRFFTLTHGRIQNEISLDRTIAGGRPHA